MKKQQGFTIIEVVLVLAIAGLIFLMVFIALPALQRNQRDTQRKSDVGRTVTAINNYQSNSKGNLPNSQSVTNRDVRDRLKVGGDSYADPSYGDYELDYEADSSGVGDPDQKHIQFVKKAVCGDNGALNASAGDRQFAVRVLLETGQVYCASNN